jgi:molybdopterin biosynthesis enzyme
MAATIRDATPIGTTFSASAIVPKPTPSIKTPKKMELANSLRVKRKEAQPLRIPIKTNKARLAATNLNDMDKSGGIVSIVKAMPMYVVPQATYIMAKPMATLVLIELLT